jgi:hypothetical protein
VTVLEADDLLRLSVTPLAGRVERVKPGLALHRGVQLDARGVVPADHLAAAQHLLGRHRAARDLRDMRVVLTVGDGQALVRHAGEADDRALAG